MATLKANGTPVANIDTMIAAQALAADAVLVSGDKVFRRVKGLKVEHWGRSGEFKNRQC